LHTAQKAFGQIILCANREVMPPPFSAILCNNGEGANDNSCERKYESVVHSYPMKPV